VSQRRLALCILLCTSAAMADDSVAPTRPVRFGEKAGQLVLTTTYPELFAGEVGEQFSNGFAQTVVVRIWVFPVGAGVPILGTGATARALYAQWEDVYLVRFNDVAGERNLVEKTPAAAIADVTALRELAVCPLTALDPMRTYFLEVLVEVNPVTPELVAEVRRWLTRPRGGQVGTESFFGSFVSIFANPGVPAADRTLRFRSQPFRRPP
jgi:hypothetical protein